MSHDEIDHAEYRNLFRGVANLPIGNSVMDRLRLRLLKGDLDRLLNLGEQLQANTSSYMSLKVNPRIQMDAVPNISATGGMVSVPGVNLDATELAPVVETIQSAVPELADGIDKADPKDVTAYVALLTALLQLIASLVAIYQTAHQQPPTPAQITQFFDNSIHQTVVVNLPPP